MDKTIIMHIMSLYSLSSDIQWQKSVRKHDHQMQKGCGRISSDWESWGTTSYTDSFLAIIHHIDIFLICDSSNFSENFEVVMDGDPTTTVDRHVDEHLTS